MAGPHRFVVGLANDEIGYLVDEASLAKDTTGQLAGYELAMGPGPRGGACIWEAHARLGWFDDAVAP